MGELGGLTGEDVPEPDGEWPIYLDGGIGYLRPDVDRYDPERPDAATLDDGTRIKLCTADAVICAGRFPAAS